MWPKRSPKMKKLPKDCPKLAVDGAQRLSHAYNHMVLGIACCCFMCFMFVGCAFMETGTCFLGFRMWAFMLIYVGFCSSWRLVGIWLWLMHGIFGRWGAKDIWMGGKFSSRGSLCWILEKTEMRTKWLDIFVVRVCWVGCCVA
jgi:hypothetical protein